MTVLPSPAEAGFAKAGWSMEDVRYRLAEAAETLRRLPMPANGRPANEVHALGAHWPEVVTATVEAYGRERVRMRPPAPAPDAIRRLDEALGWLLWLDEDARRLVWARACGVTWRRLQERDGRCHVTLGRAVKTALSVIAARLNAVVVVGRRLAVENFVYTV